ncbi:EamA family transporter [Kineococcus sp. R8]|nr:EamA family transporter [Kineococcus siccus]NAZ81185.1 EamA family transporter [Kineococcus siccus]
MVLGSCVSLQLGAACAAQLFPLVGPTPSTLLRLGVAALLLLALARPRLRSLTRSQWRAVLGLGVCLAGMNGCFYAAIARIPLGTAVTIEFLGPLALAALTSRRRRDGAWVALALAGVLLLGVTGHGSGGGALDPLGVVFALVAGAFWAAYIVAGARVGAAVPGLGGLALATGVAAVVLLPLGAGGAVAALARPELLPAMVGTAVLASVVPYSLELSALRRLPAAAFGILLSLEPAVASLAGRVLLGQHLTLPGVLGVVLVVAASAGSTLTRSRTAGRAAQTDAPSSSVPKARTTPVRERSGTAGTS